MPGWPTRVIGSYTGAAVAYAAPPRSPATTASTAAGSASPYVLATQGDRPRAAGAWLVGGSPPECRRTRWWA
eukprot:8286035-Lingulodinium_polyedra.AAC.1